MISNRGEERMGTRTLLKPLAFLFSFWVLLAGLNTIHAQEANTSTEKAATASNGPHTQTRERRGTAQNSRWSLGQWHYWPTFLSLEGEWGTDRNLALGELRVPVWQKTKSMLFADLRFRFDDNEAEEGNLGLGYRRIMNEDWILGVYGFADLLKPPNSNTFLQATIGGELLLKNWRLRLNGYLPEDNEERVSRTVAGTGEPYAFIDGTSIRINPARRYTDLFEEPMPGYDIELGYRLPVKDQQLWLHGGYFHFEDSGYATINGPRLRGEWISAIGHLPLMPQGTQAIIGAEWLHDDVRGGRALAQVAIRIPLGGKARRIPHGRRYAEQWQKWAMNARIRRDVDVVTGNRTERTGQPVAAIDTVTQEKMDVFLSMLTARQRTRAAGMRRRRW